MWPGHKSIRMQISRGSNNQTVYPATAHFIMDDTNDGIVIIIF